MRVSRRRGWAECAVRKGQQEGASAVVDLTSHGRVLASWNCASRFLIMFGIRVASSASTRLLIIASAAPH